MAPTSSKNVKRGNTTPPQSSSSGSSSSSHSSSSRSVSSESPPQSPIQNYKKHARMASLDAVVEELPKTASKSQTPIITKENWKEVVDVKLDEYQANPGKLVSEVLRFPCDFDTFENEIMKVRVSGMKAEYVQGFVEITVYPVSIIHNAVGNSRDYAEWLSHLPDQESLHRTGLAPGLESIIDVDADDGTNMNTDIPKSTLQPDLAFKSKLMTPMNHKPMIVFEVAFSESLDHVIRRGVNYLWDSSVPRTAVFVAIKITYRAHKVDFKTTEAIFEVQRRVEEKYPEVKVAERGYLWPKEKMEVPNHPRGIRFSLEELFGPVKVIDDTLEMETNPEVIDSPLIQQTLAALQNGLLLELREKVAAKATTYLPLAILTKAIFTGIDKQKRNNNANDAGGLSMEALQAMEPQSM